MFARATLRPAQSSALMTSTTNLHERIFAYETLTHRIGMREQNKKYNQHAIMYRSTKYLQMPMPTIVSIQQGRGGEGTAVRIRASEPWAVS